MAQDYTITAARNAGEKDNPHGGKLVKWYLNLADSEAGADDVYVQKKPGNDLSPGMTIYGRLEKGEFGWRIFPEQNPNAGSSGGGNFKSPSYERVPESHDDRSWSIERQVAAKCAAQVLQGVQPDGAVNAIPRLVDAFHDAIRKGPDADVGGGSTDSHVLRGHTAADVSAAPDPTVTSDAPQEASPAQKRKLTTLMRKAGLADEAIKAVVLYRCRSEKPTKDGASQLITDLLEGATHDQLIAEVHDAARAGDAVAIRARKLIPSDTPVDDGSLPELDEPVKDEADDPVPF